MDLLKKHYEKILLGVVLVGLAAAVGYLPFKINSDKQRLEEVTGNLIRPKVKPLTNLDLTIAQNALQRAAAPAALILSEPNKLFNPMPWQKTAPPDERLIPLARVGPVAAIVTNIAPLYFELTLDSVTVSDTGARYVIGVTREAAPNPAARKKKQNYVTADSKNETFTVLEIKGKPEDPSQIVVRLNDSGERAVISKEQPFKRIDGYTADIRYPPENRSWEDQRVGGLLRFAGEEYNIVAINKNEVVLSAKSNGKKWTIVSHQNAGA